MVPQGLLRHDYGRRRMDGGCEIKSCIQKPRSSTHCHPLTQVIQRRDNFGEPKESFNRNWDDYKFGFGSPSREFWLGNENIYMLTKPVEYELRLELEDFDGNQRWD